jgi:hypothetical protein
MKAGILFFILMLSFFISEAQSEIEILPSKENNLDNKLNLPQTKANATPVIEYVSGEKSQIINSNNNIENNSNNSLDEYSVTTDQLIESYKKQIYLLKVERENDLNKGLPTNEYDRKIKKLTDLINALEKSK